MQQNDRDISLQALQDIRNMMERSARFLSLSGMSGIWAGVVALAGSYVAHTWLLALPAAYYSPYRSAPASLPGSDYSTAVVKFIWLAIIVFLVALAGGIYFTWRKARAQNGTLWNTASRRMMVHLAIPLLVGAAFVLSFLYNGHENYITPACLAFYGLALINGSRYTVTDIQYLGMLELLLACISLLMPGFGLYFWAAGFGLLHILYGIIMWNKYDRALSKNNI